MRVAALCGSLRRGSYNRALLNAAIDRGAAHGLEIVPVEIADFPVFSQDREADPPEAVLRAKAMIATSQCLLLVSPEANYGVPGVLKNAIDWLSRPKGDPTLRTRPMAVTGASTGYLGTMRAQLAWRQMWHFFNQPVFSGVELVVPFAANVFDVEGRLTDEAVAQRLDVFLQALADWLAERC